MDKMRQMATNSRGMKIQGNNKIKMDKQSNNKWIVPATKMRREKKIVNFCNIHQTEYTKVFKPLAIITMTQKNSYQN